MMELKRTTPQPNALALEYQAEYGSAFGYLDVSNIVNNPNASSVVRVFGPGLLEEVSELATLEPRPLPDDGAGVSGEDESMVTPQGCDILRGSACGGSLTYCPLHRTVRPQR